MPKGKFAKEDGGVVKKGLGLTTNNLWAVEVKGRVIPENENRRLNIMIFYSSQRQCIHSIHPLTTLRLRLIVTIFTERGEKR